MTSSVSSPGSNSTCNSEERVSGASQHGVSCQQAAVQIETNINAAQQSPASHAAGSLLQNRVTEEPSHILTSKMHDTGIQDRPPTASTNVPLEDAYATSGKKLSSALSAGSDSGSSRSSSEANMPGLCLGAAAMPQPTIKPAPRLVQSSTGRIFQEDYEIGEPISKNFKGSEGEVFVATRLRDMGGGDKDKLKGTSVAVKKVHHAMLSKGAVQSIFQQIKILGWLGHQHITQQHDFYLQSDGAYLVMEKCLPTDLLQYVIERKYLDETETAIIIYQIVSALEHLQRRHIVHHDLKLANVLIKQHATNESDMVVKLADFGFSCGLKRGVTDKVCGSMGYVAPEVLARQPHGMHADMFSLGVIMYCALVGIEPFKATPNDSNEVIARRCATGHWNSKHERFKRLSTEAKSLISSLLSPNPLKRPLAKHLKSHPWILLAFKSPLPGLRPLNHAAKNESIHADASNVEHEESHASTTDNRDDDATNSFVKTMPTSYAVAAGTSQAHASGTGAWRSHGTTPLGMLPCLTAQILQRYGNDVRHAGYAVPAGESDMEVVHSETGAQRLVSLMLSEEELTAVKAMENACNCISNKRKFLVFEQAGLGRSLSIVIENWKHRSSKIDYAALRLLYRLLSAEPVEASFMVVTSAGSLLDMLGANAPLKYSMLKAVASNASSILVQNMNKVALLCSRRMCQSKNPMLDIWKLFMKKGIFASVLGCVTGQLATPQYVIVALDAIQNALEVFQSFPFDLQSQVGHFFLPETICSIKELLMRGEGEWCPLEAQGRFALSLILSIKDALDCPGLANIQEEGAKAVIQLQESYAATNREWSLGLERMISRSAAVHGHGESHMAAESCGRESSTSSSSSVGSGQEIHVTLQQSHQSQHASGSGGHPSPVLGSRRPLRP